MIEKIDLNGYWDWKLPGGIWQRKYVPSSYFCVGESTFKKEVFLSKSPGKRVLLRFEGIAYQGKVTFNHKVLGDMLPYIPYTFDITEQIKTGENLIQADIKDLLADYGPTGGWEDYGGITRGVCIEVYDTIRIDDIHWQCTFDQDYRIAQCRLEVSLENHEFSQDITVSATLSNHNQIVYQSQQVAADHAEFFRTFFEFTVVNPQLWSPDHPELYDVVIVVNAGKSQDEKNIRVGFRELKAIGSRLYLNGEEIFLKGVARHEMWGKAQGFTLSAEQIVTDLRLIKNLGANFVRLVHYPHSKTTITLCDELGLMATEEPGLWWSDLTNEKVTSKALEIMEKTILRDRNNPCIIAWLLYNECKFEGAIEYLRKGKQLCNRLDPGKLVSAANCLDPTEAGRIFDQAEMDFYTFHPYSYEPYLMTDGLQKMRGKPLVFTEWGGYLIVNNPNLIQWFTRVLKEYANNRDPQPNLAGMVWWQFQDIFQFSRGIPACVNGSLTEGLVDIHRNLKPMYEVMMGLLAEVGKRELPEDHLELPSQLITGEGEPTTLAIQFEALQKSEAQRNAWLQVLERLQVFQTIGQNQIRRSQGPILFHPLENIGGINTHLAGRPLILTSECEQITIPIGLAVEKLYFFGQTTFFDGYPVRGQLGEMVASYTICYEDGSQELIPLRNGYEMASASIIARTSRIDPIAANTLRVMTLHMDEDWEIYQVGCLIVPVRSGKRIESIEFQHIDERYNPLLYGISAQTRP